MAGSRSRSSGMTEASEVQGWLAAYKKMTEVAGLWNVGAIKVVPYDDE